MAFVRLFIAGLICLIVSLSSTSRATRERSFIITGTDYSDGLSRTKRDVGRIQSLRVTSVIVSRFARVTVVSQMRNYANQSKEMIFSVRLPTSAFITEFHMVVGGITFVGKVKEKAAAQEQYDRAVQSGNTAGLVVADVRETKTFDISANVPPQSSVDFHLVYQELLRRKLGEYEHVILVNPKQVIEDFGVDVYITESSGITSLSTKSSAGKQKNEGGQELAEITSDIRRSKTQAKVSLTLKGSEIRRFLKLPEDEQKFVLNYDVTRESLGGEIKMRNGYFVHFFAPDDLQILPKRVVFVIDRSGSMRGRKLEQTKTAFTSVLRELRESDKFNIISFSDSATSWSGEENELVPATATNVESAIKHVGKITAIGSTNLNDALIKASDLLSHRSTESRASNAIILLTDGMPTVGVTNSQQIRLNVKRSISGRFSLFCLGFGEDLNHNFLKRLADENEGVARKIYEASDADIQLQGFFQEVASPLLLNVQMSYSGANVEQISQTNFEKYFGGSEAIIVGIYGGDQTEILSTIHAESTEGEVSYNIAGVELDDNFQHWYKDTGEFDDFIEHLWAYFTVSKLLERRSISDNQLERQELRDRILRLAVKYNFVTPLTSLVVTLPEDEVSSSTVSPTIVPPCYLRGATIPGQARHTIRCPELLQSRIQSDQPAQITTPLSLPMRRMSAIKRLLNSRRPHHKSRSRILSMSSGKRSDLARAITNSRRRLHHSYSLSGKVHGAKVMRYRIIEAPATRREPRNWNGCSGTLRELSGTVQLTTSRGPRETFLCKQRIRLGQRSWIDLHVTLANTTQNKVTITSQGRTIFSHNGGTTSPQSFYLEHNTADIVFTVYRDDNIRPGILISYEEFTPNQERNAIGSSPNPFDVATVNCGKDISSSDSLSGNIISPNFPSMYPENSHCLWNLHRTESDLRLKLTIVNIDIESTADGECNHDRLIILEGENEHNICGYDAIDDIITSETTTKIVFISDEVLEAPGFKIRYEFIPASDGE